MSDGFIWGDAEVTYPDWRGTAQLDQRMTTVGVEEAVGLDPSAWLVVGIDIGGGEYGHELRVIAVDRRIVPDGGDVFPRIAEEHGGEIPATMFLIHDADPYVVLKAITHLFELRLRPRGARDLPIRIVDQSDVPDQE